MDFHLVLRGTGLCGGVAGMGGDELPASIWPEGDLNQPVLYIDKTAGAGFIKTIAERLADPGSEASVAYISSGSFRFIDQFGIVLHDPLVHRQQIQKVGPGTYALHRIR